MMKSGQPSSAKCAINFYRERNLLSSIWWICMWSENVLCYFGNYEKRPLPLWSRHRTLWWQDFSADNYDGRKSAHFNGQQSGQTAPLRWPPWILTKFRLVFTIRCLELAPKGETSIDWLIWKVRCSDWSYFACVDSLINSGLAIILEVLKWMAVSVIPRIKLVFFPSIVWWINMWNFFIMKFFIFYFLNS